jgi:hypothetical protein
MAIEHTLKIRDVFLMCLKNVFLGKRVKIKITSLLRISQKQRQPAIQSRVN